MVDLVKTIIKWLIVALVFLLLISIISKASNKTTTNKTKLNKTNTSTGVRTIKKEKQNEEVVSQTNTTEEETPKEINTPDTGVNNNLSLIIGTIILGSATFYIYKSRKQTN